MSILLLRTEIKVGFDFDGTLSTTLRQLVAEAECAFQASKLR